MRGRSARVTISTAADARSSLPVLRLSWQLDERSGSLHALLASLFRGEFSQSLSSQKLCNQLCTCSRLLRCSSSDEQYQSHAAGCMPGDTNCAQMANRKGEQAPLYHFTAASNMLLQRDAAVERLSMLRPPRLAHAWAHGPTWKVSTRHTSATRRRVESQDLRRVEAAHRHYTHITANTHTSSR